MTKLNDLKARLMIDPKFRQEYAHTDEEYALIEVLVRARAAANLTQTGLAQRLGTTQSAVARLEGGKVSPSRRDPSSPCPSDWNATDREPCASGWLKQLAGRAASFTQYSDWREYNQ